MDDIRVGLDIGDLRRAAQEAEAILRQLADEVMVGVGVDNDPLKDGVGEAKSLLDKLSDAAATIRIDLDNRTFQAEIDETRRVLDGLGDENFAAVVGVEVRGVEQARKELNELDASTFQGDRKTVTHDLRQLRGAAQERIPQVPPPEPQEPIPPPMPQPTGNGLGELGGEVLQAFAGGGVGGLQGLAMGKIAALGKIGLAIFAIQQAFGALQAAGRAAYQLLIAQADQYERTLISTRGALAGTTDIFVDGAKVDDPTKALEALEAPLGKAMDRLRREGANLVTPFSQQTDVFQVVAGQISGIGGGLDDAVDLTLKFAAGLDALGLPAYQARQEINSLLTATADQNSVLAQRLFGSTQAANEAIRRWKQEGTLIENVTKRLEAYGEAARLSTLTVYGLGENIGDQMEQIQLRLGQGLTAPVKAGLGEVLQFLTRIQESEAMKVLADGLKDVGATGEDIAEILGGSVGDGMADWLETSIRLVGELVALLDGLLGDLGKILAFVGGNLAKGSFTTLAAPIKALNEILYLLNQVIGVGQAFRDSLFGDADLGTELNRVGQNLQRRLTGETEEQTYARELNKELTGAKSTEDIKAAKERAAKNAGVAPDSNVVIKAKTLTDEQFNTPERVQDAWSRAYQEIGRGYQVAMQGITLEQATAERQILESVANTESGEREASRRRVQVELAAIQEKLDAEQAALPERERLLAEQAARVLATEEEIARLKADGIQEQEDQTIDKLTARLEKERAEERKAQDDIAQGRQALEELTTNAIQKRREEERLARDEAIRGIRIQAQESAHAYDMQIQGLQAVSQAIATQQSALQGQASILQEQLRGIQLEKDAALAGVDDPVKAAKISAKFLERELAIKRDIAEIEIKLAELAARRSEIEARRAALTAQKELTAAQSELESAQASGDESAVRAAENRLELARESANLAQEQAAAAQDELATTKELGRIKKQNLSREEANARDAARRQTANAIRQKEQQQQAEAGDKGGGGQPGGNGQQAGGTTAISQYRAELEGITSQIGEATGEFDALTAEADGLKAAMQGLRDQIKNVTGGLGAGGSPSGGSLPGGMGVGMGERPGGMSVGGLPRTPVGVGGGFGNTLGREGARGGVSGSPASAGGNRTEINVAVGGDAGSQKQAQDITLAVMDALGRA